MADTFAIGTKHGGGAGVELEGARPQLVVRHGRARGATTKGGKVRRVPLLSPARDALTSWGDPVEARARLVFPAPHGGAYANGHDWGWAHRVYRDTRRPGLRDRAGIERRVTWHDATRHTCATHLLLGTAAPWLVPRALRLEEVWRAVALAIDLARRVVEEDAGELARHSQAPAQTGRAYTVPTRGRIRS